jgi:hypothetical protein
MGTRNASYSINGTIILQHDPEMSPAMQVTRRHQHDTKRTSTKKPTRLSK